LRIEHYELLLNDSVTNIGEFNGSKDLLDTQLSMIYNRLSTYLAGGI